MVGVMAGFCVTPIPARYGFHMIQFLLVLYLCQGVPPATVAEFTLQGDGNRDFYDGNRLLPLSL